MNCKLSIGLILATVLLCGCEINYTEAYARIEQGLDQVDQEKLRSDAEKVWANSPKGFSRISRRQWPPSFKVFTPREVLRDYHGIYIVVDESSWERVGIYIVLEAEYVPDNQLNQSYGALATDIYRAHRHKE